MDQPMDVLAMFPVRKSRRQKAVFRKAVRSYCEELGYSVSVESGSFGVKNVVIGDPDQARYLITAHYDTCAWLPFPNLITPCNFLLFFAYQFLLTAFLIVPAAAVSAAVALAVNAPELIGLIAYALLLLELALMLFGPANRHNANDNTSGVVALLTVLRDLPVGERDQVCFVLFDLEESGLLGSSSYRSKHRKATSRQFLFNLDCVGEGNEILLFPTKKLKKEQSRIEACRARCTGSNEKTFCIRDRGFAVFPSDQANFPYGFGIAALCRSKWAGLYLGKIHTNRDRILDEKNVALITDNLIRMIQCRI